ncbi:MAG: lycopene beta-cyclase CrtY, partial [Gammaproteobacteria bacterium]|nr:lycopene beta-cyclase CrtY [Gammaproteobacteria bacterium]
TVLIEDTRYSDSPRVEPETYREEIAAYAAARGWEIATVLEEEQGVLPITLDGDIEAFWDADAARVPRSGLRAALFHPGTGYSLPNALQLADRLAAHTDWSAEAVYAATRGASTELWEATGYYRRLNRLLFLAAQPHERFKVLARFYGLNAGLISRFYAGTNNRFDKIRILVGKPPVGVGPAISTLLLHRGR